MNWNKQLIAPITYGGKVTEENWELAFGKRKDGLNEEPPPQEGVYERKLREAMERQSESKVK
jgi:hypothetical protein